MALVRLVTFDATETLIHLRQSVGRLYAQYAFDHGGHIYDADHLQRSFLINFDEMNRQQPCFGYDSELSDDLATKQKNWWRQVAMDTFASETSNPLDLVTRKRLADDLYDYFDSVEPWVLDPEATKVLQRLRKKGISVAALSNNDSRLRKLFGQFGIADLIQFTFLSGELGLAKPDIRLFRLVEKISKTPPEEIVHVGNHHQKDYLAARHAGWQAYLLTRGKPPTVDEAHRINSLAQLVEKIK